MDGGTMAIKKAQKKATTKKPAQKAATSVKKPVTRSTDLPTAAVVRIAKANGADRVGSDGAAAIVSMAEEYIGKLTKEANKLAAHGGRKTLKADDIEMAAEKFA